MHHVCFRSERRCPSRPQASFARPRPGQAFMELHQEHPELAFKPHNLQANQMSSRESMALYDAALKLNTRQVEAQLTAGANPNWYNNQAGGATALHAAARGEGQEASKIVAILLKGGAVPDVLTLPEFNTPLHLAACKGNLESVKHLLDAQGGLEQISRPNTFQNSPLHEACICASEPVVSHLLSKGAQVDMPNKRGSTPLLFAVYCDKPSRGVVQALLNAGANAKHVDEDGVGVLHICALKNHVELLRMFMEQGVTPEPDKAGNSPAFYAKMKGHKDALRVLGEPEE